MDLEAKDLTGLDVSKLVTRIKKLRWIGMEEEAKQLERLLRLFQLLHYVDSTEIVLREAGAPAAPH